MRCKVWVRNYRILHTSIYANTSVHAIHLHAPCTSVQPLLHLYTHVCLYNPQYVYASCTSVCPLHVCTPPCTSVYPLYICMLPVCLYTSLHLYAPVHLYISMPLYICESPIHMYTPCTSPIYLCPLYIYTSPIHRSSAHFYHVFANYWAFCDRFIEIGIKSGKGTKKNKWIKNQWSL